MWTDVDEALKILDDMAFLEHGEEKVVLTTHLIEHVEKSIDEGSKEAYMQDISQYYTDLLTEFYQKNSRIETKEESDEHTSSNRESIMSPTLSTSTPNTKSSFKHLIE